MTLQAWKMYGCHVVTCLLNTLRAEMHGHITSVPGVRNVTCHPHAHHLLRRQIDCSLNVLKGIFAYGSYRNKPVTSYDIIS